MNHILPLSSFVRPYGRRAALALVLLSSLVVMDLSIPRLIERIIDQGISRGDMAVVASTAAIMVVLSLLSAVLAVGNNYYSVQVGEGVARDLRQALFLKIQSFSYGNLDKQQTGPLMT
ncbi:MAG: ABC transporter transmembrane domain-containing protein, partial [Anaerolineales bacterium]